jgi:hypothetical protein
LHRRRKSRTDPEKVKPITGPVRRWQYRKKAMLNWPPCANSVK